eukprot:c23381_g1_i1 orf=480-2165(-)
MGPAILLCPSSSAAHLWGQVSPLKKTRHTDGNISLSHGFPRGSAHVCCTGDLIRRPAFPFHPVLSSQKCRKPNYPFAWRRVSAAAAGAEVSVEEATDVSVAEATEVPEEEPTAALSGEAPAEQSISAEPSTSGEGTPVATERKTQARRALNRSNSNANKAAVVVSTAELLPGAVFPGKVTSIQSFGAFVDLGAFTNGLVHISRLSKSYVKTVEDVVQLGQEVKVQVLEVDLQANRISLMLVEEGREETEQEGEAGEKQRQRPSQQQARTPRRDPSKRANPKQAVTTMKKGEICTGTVKNMIKSGVFVTLPDGTDGYLPAGEVVFKGPYTNLEAQFQVGQEITVRVLRIERGRVNLTMKREMNYDQINEDLNKDVVDVATNPFEIAFRRNELIASFLSDRDKQKAQVESKDEASKEEEAVEEVKDAAEKVKPDVEEILENQVEASKDEAVLSEADVEKDTPKESVTAVEEKVVEAFQDEAVSSEADAEKLMKEGADTVEESVTAVEDAIVEQAVTSVEEVADPAEEVSMKMQAEDDGKDDTIASVEESVKGNGQDAAALVEG